MFTFSPEGVVLQLWLTDLPVECLFSPPAPVWASPSFTAFTRLRLTIVSFQINLTQLTVCSTPVIVAASVKRCTWSRCQSCWRFVCVCPMKLETRRETDLQKLMEQKVKFVCKTAVLLSIILMGSMILNKFYCSLCQTGQILISLHTERNVFVLLLPFTFICFHAKNGRELRNVFQKPLKAALRLSWVSKTLFGRHNEILQVGERLLLADWAAFYRFISSPPSYETHATLTAHASF